MKARSAIAWSSFLRWSPVLVLGFFVLYPLGMLVFGAFWSAARITQPGHLTFAVIANVLQDPAVHQVIWNTVVVSLGATVISVVIGAPLAWLSIRTDMPGRSLVRTATLLPFFTSTVLVGISWALLLSPQIGLLNRAVVWLGLAPLNVFSLPGLTLVTGLYHVPYVYLFASASYRSMDASLEESSQIVGASVFTTMRRITLPLMLPSITSAALLVAVSSMGLFGIAAILGTPQGVFILPNYIQRLISVYPAKYNSAAAVAVCLIALAFVLVFLQKLATNREKKYVTVTGKSTRVRQVALGRWRWPSVAIYATFLLVAVGLPFAVLVVASLSPFWSPTVDWSQLSLVQFREIFFGNMSGRFFNAFLNSIILSVSAATLSIFLCLGVAWNVHRSNRGGRAVAEIITMIPVAIPGIVFGIAFLWAWIRFPIQIYGTLWILIIAYLTRTTPHSTRVIGSSLQQISRDLEEAAAVVGATWLQIIRRIILPILLPGLIAAWSFVFVLSLKELNTSILLVTPSSNVLSTLIYDVYQEGSFATLSALVLIQAAMAAVALALLDSVAARISTSNNKTADSGPALGA
jgi:iron(III) transport system permease protein